MKTHTNRFKEEIGSNGRQLDSIITYQLNGVAQTLTSEQLNGVTPTFQGAILKSVMKQLDVDSNVDIPIGTSINYKFGVLVDGTFEYLNFGNYIVYSSEKQEDLESYKLICYDKLLFSMMDNQDLGVTYPISVRDYLKALCNKLGLQFKNENDNFVNYSRMIQKELYVGQEYTYRDILDELAQVTASTICLDENDKLELRYISNNAVDTINEEYLKDVNINFSEKYGKVNSIVLSRSGESDNVYLRDEESVQANGLCELKIVDNQIMNWNDRSDYLPEILDKLDGLEYYINDFVSTGITYLELCDRYNVKIGDNTYSCVMLNDEIEITQGLVENIHTDMPEEAKTDYTKADKTDRRINETWIIVNKQKGNITSLTRKVETIETLQEDVYTKEQVNQLVQTAESGLINTFTISGGNNLLRNTAPWFMKSENTAEFWNGNLKQIVEPEATSGYAILTQNGTISQSVSLPTGTYSVSFKYKKLINASEGYVRYNGKTFNLTETSGEVHSSGEITNNQFVIEINSNSNDSFEIYDLILKHGSEGLENMLVWTQNANESRSDTVQISEGITTTSSVTDTKATMDSAGFIVRNKTTGIAVMEATKTGGKFLDLTSTGKSNLSGLLVQKVGSKICINGESGS